MFDCCRSRTRTGVQNFQVLPACSRGKGRNRGHIVCKGYHSLIQAAGTQKLTRLCVTVRAVSERKLRKSELKQKLCSMMNSFPL